MRLGGRELPLAPSLGKTEAEWERILTQSCRSFDRLDADKDGYLIDAPLDNARTNSLG